MRTGFEAPSERDPDHLDYDYAQMLAAMGNHAEALVKLVTALAGCPFEPEWDIEAAASYLHWKILNAPKRSLQWLQSRSRALMKLL